jgi:hypothetical protein
LTARGAGAFGWPDFRATPRTPGGLERIFYLIACPAMKMQIAIVKEISVCLSDRFWITAILILVLYM